MGLCRCLRVYMYMCVSRACVCCHIPLFESEVRWHGACVFCKSKLKEFAPKFTCPQTPVHCLCAVRVCVVRAGAHNNAYLARAQGSERECVCVCVFVFVCAPRHLAQMHPSGVLDATS